MKLLYTATFFFCALFFFLLKKETLKFTGRETAGEESPLERLKWEHDRIADPATGEIPSMGLWKAYQQLVAQGKMPMQPFINQANLRDVQWEPVNDFFSSLAITKMTYDPNNTQIFYFCTGEGWYSADASIGAGVFKSSDGGNTWNQLPSTDTSLFNYCQDIDVHPFTSDVYLAAISGLWRSKDGGVTWKKVLNPPALPLTGTHAVADVEFTKNGGIFATTGIFQAGSIYYSESGDSGTWVTQTNGFPTTGIYRIELATAPSNDSVAYAVACKNTDYSIKGIYKTTDKGNTWMQVSTPGENDTTFAHFQAWYDLVLAVDPKDANTVIGGGWKWWRTHDGGTTWQKLSEGNPDSTAYPYAHVDEHAIVFRNSDTVYFGCDGGVWKSGNMSANNPGIYDRNYGYRVTQIYCGAIHPDAGNISAVGGTQDNGTIQLLYGGISPNHKLTGYDGSFCIINQQNPAIIYTNKNQLGTFRYKNAGFDIPDTITNSHLTNDSVEWNNPMVADPNDPEILYMGSNKGIFRLKNASTATKNDWVKASKPMVNMTALAVSKSQPHTVFIGRYVVGNIYRVENADTSTSTHAMIDCDPSNQLPANTTCSCVFVDPLDVNHVYATYSNYGKANIWESTNAVSASPTWKSHDGDLPDLPVFWILPHPTKHDVCYVATDLGVFYTSNFTATTPNWLPMNTGLANIRVSQLLYRDNDHSVYAFTYGRGIFTGTMPMSGPDYSFTWAEHGPLDVGGRTRAIMIDPNDPTGQTIWAAAVSGGLWKTTSIDALPAVGISSLQKNDFDLKVFPNPVSSSGTEIQFTLPQTENISLVVYDAEGKMVEQLWKGNAATGMHRLHWTAKNQEGIFYIVMKGDGNQAVKKVMVMHQ